MPSPSRAPPGPSRFGDDSLLTTDGPFLESKEQLAGFFIVDCATPERAVEIATASPARPSRSVRSWTRPNPRYDVRQRWSPVV
jgi:hypothetical protein